MPFGWWPIKNQQAKQSPSQPNSQKKKKKAMGILKIAKSSAKTLEEKKKPCPNTKTIIKETAMKLTRSWLMRVF